jgi:phosphorylase kinase alpha/beta subunit
MLVCGKQVTLGVPGFEEHVISAPIGPFEIKDIMYNKVQPHSLYEAVLQQEIVIFLSSYISSSPMTFQGMLRIRIGWILQAMKNELQEKNKCMVGFDQCHIIFKMYACKCALDCILLE